MFGFEEREFSSTRQLSRGLVHCHPRSLLLSRSSKAEQLVATELYRPQLVAISSAPAAPLPSLTRCS